MTENKKDIIAATWRDMVRLVFLVGRIVVGTITAIFKIVFSSQIWRYVSFARKVKKKNETNSAEAYTVWSNGIGMKVVKVVVKFRPRPTLTAVETMPEDWFLLSGLYPTEEAAREYQAFLSDL